MHYAMWYSFGTVRSEQQMQLLQKHPLLVVTLQSTNPLMNPDGGSVRICYCACSGV